MISTEPVISEHVGQASRLPSNPTGLQPHFFSLPLRKGTESFPSQFWNSVNSIKTLQPSDRG